VSTTSTGGAGVASPLVDPLGSQNSIIFSPDLRYVLVVNGGSNTISVLSRNINGSLTLASVVSSNPGFNSSKPVSVVASGYLVYVLNQGAQASIQGYSADWTTGVLSPISGSNRTFPGAYGQIGLSQKNQVILTGKGGNYFRVFNLDNNFVPTSTAGVVTSTSTPLVPFSFVWDPSHQYLLVAVAGVGGVASFSVSSNGVLSQVSLYNTSSAASCWIARNPASSNFYVVNAGQPSITGFRSGTSGTISRINGNLFTSATTVSQEVALFGLGSAPTDLSISSNNLFLHVVLGGRGTLATFEINEDGTLLPRGEVPISQPGENAAGSGVLAA